MQEHPKTNRPIPNHPFESEGAHQDADQRVLREQREQSGNLPDQPADNPVKDTKPFKNLRSR